MLVLNTNFLEQLLKIFLMFLEKKICAWILNSKKQFFIFKKKFCGVNKTKFIK